MTALTAPDLVLRRNVAAPLGLAYAPAPRAAEVADVERPFEELRRDAPDVGMSGVHPTAVVILIGFYALLMCSFWAFFGDRETALTLGVITILATMFFGLLGGGILLSDSLPKGQRGRGFDEFIEGRVLTATGWIEGREALAQILTLPASLLVGSIVFGAIWCITAR